MQNPPLLLVAATEGETTLLRTQLNFHALNAHYWESPDQKIGLLHTGIGMANTAWMLGKYLAQSRPEQMVHVGIAGAFDRSLLLGEVVEVVEDIFSEMGAQSPEGFLDLSALGFPLWQEGDHEHFNRLVNPTPWGGELTQVRSITVNTVHGLTDSIAATQSLWHPQVESMEGAAFFMAAMRTGISAHAFRSISNYVEVRNREAWDIPLALRSLTDFLVANLAAIAP